MASLKIFVSSTCYDMHATRNQLRATLSDLGYEPVMSEYSDVLFDPQQHTHTSCLREVENCDMLVLVVGGRFGGASVPKALEQLQLDHLRDMSGAESFGVDRTNISITQAEVLKAIKMGIPVFAFVEGAVLRDHLTYEKNKTKAFIAQVEFSSIEKTETATYIFEFINFLRLRNQNNGIFEFSRFEDLEDQLKKQWAALFQRLLLEQKSKALEDSNIETLSMQIAGLKAAVLSSISNNTLKETAKGAIKFRMLVDFLHSVASDYRPTEEQRLLRSTLTWSEMMVALGIVGVLPEVSSGPLSMSSVILIRDDGTYYRARFSQRALARIEREWDDFISLNLEARSAIIGAVVDSLDSRPNLMLRHFDKAYSADSDERSEVDAEWRSLLAPNQLPGIRAEKLGASSSSTAREL